MAVIPEEDRITLSELGYDVGVHIGAGNYGHVFNDVCNKNAFKEYRISEEEFAKAIYKKYRKRDGMPYEKRPLIGKTCAIKQLDIRSSETAQDGLDVLTETSVLVILSHPNIVELFLTFRTSQYGYIVMEYTNGGTLADLMLEYRLANKKFEEWEVNDLFRGLIEGLNYLHSMNVEHRDINSENIMFSINDNNRRVVKYVDFGVAREAHKKPNFNFDVLHLSAQLRPILAESNFGLKPVYNELVQIIDRMQLTLFEIVYRNAIDVRNDMIPVLDRMETEPMAEINLNDEYDSDQNEIV